MGGSLHLEQIDAGPRRRSNLRLSPLAEVSSAFRPRETGPRGGDITRFSEPERGLVSRGLFRPDRGCENVPGLDSYAPAPGAYQIGELHARSWIVAGSPPGIAMPSAAASRVLQRGVGISSTRT